jgi:Uma2 family endonuclease
MGEPAQKIAKRATIADLEAVPAHQVAELIRGTLHVMPRPAPRHANAEGGLIDELRGPFQRGRGGPGGWWILPEPELRFPDPEVPEALDAVVPDLAGWRRERLPELPEEAAFRLSPDWVCEILSKSTEAVDREEKMPLYAREGVAHAWLLDPGARSLEVYALGRGGVWRKPVIFRGSGLVRAAPFEAIEVDLSSLWGG